MSPAQTFLFGPAPMAQVRRSDPAPAKHAAAENPDGRQAQATRILRWLWEHGSITADTAHRELTEKDEGATRGDWSARIGVLMSAKGGRLVERWGQTDDVGRGGRVRSVTRYRLTAEGHRECARMLGGVG